MSIEPPRLPLPVRAFNLAGGLLARAGVPLFDLGMDSLMERAARRTGLSDFGDPYFREPLAILLESLETEAVLSPLGRYTARSESIRCLENRLCMADVHKHHPEIAEGAIQRPLFILGLPRTGTSILHELFAQDPANRVPMTWEVMKVWPPPERATYDRDPRIQESQRHLAAIDRLLPEFKRMHPMGALLPQECVALMCHDFATIQFHTTYRVPAYQRWLEAQDGRAIYRSHRRQLQYLQWKCPAERWILKSPGHLWMLDALLDEYPDSLIVQTHRDPLRVLASLVTLITTLRGLSSRRVDSLEIAHDWTQRLARGLDSAARTRKHRRLQPERVFDMHFHELLKDEVGMVRRIYRHFGRELSDDAAQRMRAFLAGHSRDQRGRHHYTFSDTGLQASEERQRFAGYQKYFGVPSERLS